MQRPRARQKPVSWSTRQSGPACLVVILALLPCVVLAFTSTAAAAPLAAAKSRPSVSWSLASGVREGNPIPFTWSARRLDKARLVIQRPVGTSHTWKTMTTLKTRSGSGEMPGVPLGRYRYRIAALEGRRVLAQQVVGVSVFGMVPFSTLFRGSYLNSPADIESGVYASPSSSFPYIGEAPVGDRGRPNTVFSVKRNRCSAVHIGFVLGETRGEEYSYPSSIYGVVTLAQQSRDPVASEVPLNGIGSVDAELVPGQTWSMLVAENNRDGIAGGPTVYFNGYAICNSAEPFSS